MAAWYLVIFLGLVTHSYVERSLCPPDDLVSGICTNDNIVELLHRLILAFAGLSAIAVVLSAVLVAPSYRILVAWVSFLTGFAVAVHVAWGFPEFYAAAISGFLTSIAITALNWRWKPCR
ncbi:hypothetical protein [Chitinolyticbacter albus]|uniref:hypothetical protein n=1 Tax=Chitinolyticbacter albus TaxID=2961951 RepID=UPI00210B61A9|nr:hypothetical protein [Chitinolyticbacter albus]